MSKSKTFQDAIANGVSIDDFNKVFTEEVNMLLNDMKSKYDIKDDALKYVVIAFESGVNLGMSLVAQTILATREPEEGSAVH